MLNKLGLTVPVLLDGGLGTELQKGGMEAGKSTISQNLERPALLAKIHTAYIEAGAQVIAANTFAGNIAILRKSGIAQQEEQLNLQGMRLAKQMAAGLALTAADIGPTGEFFQQDFDFHSVKEIFVRQARILIKEPPDFFFIETMFDLREALAALAGIKEVCGDIPVAAGMTFNKTKRGYFTVMGNKADDCMKQLVNAGADAVGINCTLTPPEMIDLVKEIKDAVDVPVIAQPNAGQPEAVNGEMIYQVDPQEFADGLVKLYQAGAEMVGGCCGSTPEMIKITAKMLYH